MRPGVLGDVAQAAAHCQPLRTGTAFPLAHMHCRQAMSSQRCALPALACACTLPRIQPGHDAQRTVAAQQEARHIGRQSGLGEWRHVAIAELAAVAAAGAMATVAAPSTTVTWWPARVRAAALASPTMPAPMTVTWHALAVFAGAADQ